MLGRRTEGYALMLARDAVAGMERRTVTADYVLSCRKHREPMLNVG
jgi:hypothetical protein